MGLRQPGPNRGLWPQTISSPLAQAAGDTQGGQRGACGPEGGAQRDRLSLKRERSTVFPWWSPGFQKGSPDPLDCPGRANRMRKEPWACGPDPLPLSLVSSSAGRASRSPETRLFLSLLSLGQDHLSGPAAGEQADGRTASQGEPICSLFPPCSSGSSQCLSAGRTVGPA